MSVNMIASRPAPSRHPRIARPLRAGVPGPSRGSGADSVSGGMKRPLIGSAKAGLIVPGQGRSATQKLARADAGAA